MLECLKATYGHATRYILKRQQSFTNGAPIHGPSTPFSTFLEPIGFAPTPQTSWATIW